jgi:hypothetical protein
VLKNAAAALWQSDHDDIDAVSIATDEDRELVGKTAIE